MILPTEAKPMKHFLVRSSILMTLLVAAVAAPSVASAQGVDTVAAADTAKPAQAAPPAMSTGMSPAIAPVGAMRSMAIAPVDIPAHSFAAGENVGKPRAQMGVGLASIVIGIIAGGDIGTLFLVAGGIIGLMGLYNYMQ
jgi:hypothetical protein